MKFSLGQAARETGLDKSTLSRAIKSGRLSAQRKNGNSGYEIDPAELFRVFPPVPKAQASSPPVDAPADVLLENRELRIKLEAAQASHDAAGAPPSGAILGKYARPNG